MKRGAIFDMDGTLLDTEKFYRQAWLDVAAEFGEETNPRLPAAMSGTNPGEEAERIMKNFYPNVNARAYIDRVLEYARARIEEDLQPMPGVAEILTFLKSAGVKCAVASAAPVSVVEKNLQRTNLRGYFDVIVGGNMVTNGKPAPDIFLLAAERLNLPASNCYVFEDSFNGIRAAHASGGVAIMIPDTVQPTDEIRNLCAAIYPNMFEAKQSIEEGRL